MDDLLQEFIAETRETLAALAGEIVAWEADPADRARLDAIFRFVHTVKGSCGFLDLPRLARLSHAAEDVLAAVRSGERAPDTALVNAILAIVDRIGELVEAIDAGVALDDSSEELLLLALSQDALPAPAAVPAVAARAPTRSVRLSVDLLDRMMSGVSDIVLARNELARRVRERDDTTIETTLNRLSTTLAELRDTVTRTRMQTIDALFSPLPRVVRDAAAALGKQVALTIEGADVELDREMIEMLRDPLVHIVRNSIDHGIETPAERGAAGKPATGRLGITAHQSGSRIIVEIVDDGRGIDIDRLTARIVARDPARAPALRAMTARERLDLVFEPGLSSRDEVTAMSGRGVGMDVVRSNVEQLGGSISLTNQIGQGLTILLEVPLTLAILSAVIVEAGGHRFAIPRSAIDELVASDAATVRIDAVGDVRLATVRGRRLPLVALDALVGEAARDEGMLIIVDVPGRNYAMMVDAVIDIEELVVKPAAPAVMAAGIYAGQTLPDDGRPLLVLDCAGIATAAGLRFARAAPADDVAAPADEDQGLNVLLFDDLDGQRRVLPLAAIDRIETVAAAAIRRLAGRLWLHVPDGVVPIVASGALDPDDGTVTVIRLRDDRGEIGYAIRAAIDIMTALPGARLPGRGDMLAGIVMAQGDAVEALDPAAVIAAGCDGLVPLCLLYGASSDWMDTFLAPAIASAGYRVTHRLAPGETAAVTLAMDDDDLDAGGQLASGGRVIRLSADRDGQLYRYDRDAVLAALAGETAR